MIETIVSSIFHFFKTLGPGGVFLSMFFENLGIPLPIEIGYLLGQEMVSSGRHSWEFVVFILTLGHTLGAIVSYLVGRWGSQVLVQRLVRNKRIVSVHDKLEVWYEKYGNITVFATRFIGYVRPWSSFVAGFAGIRFLPFIIWTFLGSFIFNIIALYFSGIVIMIWRRYEFFHFGMSLIGLCLFFGLVIYAIYKQFKSKTK